MTGRFDPLIARTTILIGLRIIDYKNILRTYYDRDTGQLSYRYQMGFVPLLAFRVDFFAGRGRKENAN